MILDKYLSTKGRQIDEKVNLSAGTLAWGLEAKKRTQKEPDFINGTIGSATEDDGTLMVLPTLMRELQELTADQLFAYANMRGQNEFVQAWKKDTLESYPINLRKKAEKLSTLPITVCGGLTGGLTITGQLFLNENDVLLSPNSRWGNVDNVFYKNQNLREVTYNLVDKEGNLSFSDLISKLKESEKTEKRVGVYLNFPNNPSGISPNLEQINKFKEYIQDIKIPAIIILDDAYENYVYEKDVLDHSVFPYLIGINDNIITIKVDGTSKRFCAYGARLGNVSLGFGIERSEEEKHQVRETIAKVARTNTSSAPRGIQEALTNVLTDSKKYEQIKKEKERNLQILTRRYKLIKKLGEEEENQILKPVNFNSGFFSYYLIKNQQSASEISAKLMEKGLGTVPFVNVKNGLNGVRVAFCSISEQRMEQAINMLYSIDI